MDYTRVERVATTLAEALDLAFGPGRIAPGGTLAPGSVDEACRLVAAAHAHKAPVVPAGVAVPGAGVGLDLEALGGVVEVDNSGGLVTLECGLSVGALEERLAEDGLALEPGHFADPSRTVGAALRFGEGRALVVALGAILPDGTPFETPRAPGAVAGPDPAALVLLGGGRLGLMVTATLRCHPRVTEAVQAWRGPPAAMLLQTRDLLRGGARASAVSAHRVGRSLVVTWVGPDGAEYPDAVPAAPGPVRPAAGRPVRKRWSELLAAPPRSVARLDAWGGECRDTTGAPVPDPWLDAVALALDPQGTLAAWGSASGGRAPPEAA